ncbi:hypothetical protein HYR99_20175 [Candidatus Poribacteria bacterium]|nr:hypothetical protein [Candidatus Poribacteria bacterium]
MLQHFALACDSDLREVPAGWVRFLVVPAHALFVAGAALAAKGYDRALRHQSSPRPRKRLGFVPHPNLRGLVGDRAAATRDRDAPGELEGDRAGPLMIERVCPPDHLMVR